MKSEINILQDKYNLISNIYDIIDFPFEYLRYRNLREIVWKFARGRVLDAGVGTGRNIDFYPSDGEVIGIDLSEGMLKKARKRADRNNITVDLYKMNILNMSFPDNYFDTVIATFIFCVLPDSLQIAVLREIRRVCKKNGEIIILEYTLSQKRLRRLWMNAIAPYLEWMFGSGFDRQTSEHIRKENFLILEETFLIADVIKLIRIKA
ncbi:MAG: class I SAM-dependent methyltransferase [Nitrospirota bacterium]